jgi:hypothetical protein
MPIDVRCHHGHTFQVSEDKEGEYVPCPICNMIMPVPVVGYFERKAPPKTNTAKASPARAPKASVKANAAIEHAVPARPVRPAAPGIARSSPFTFGLGLYVLKVALLSAGLILLFVLSFLPNRQELDYLGTAVAPGLFCASGLVGLLGGLLCVGGAGTSRVRFWFLLAMVLDAAQAILAALRWVPGVDIAAFETDLIAMLAQLMPAGHKVGATTGLEMALIATLAGVAAWGVLLVALWLFAEDQDLSALADDAKVFLVRWLVQVGLTWGLCWLIPVLIMTCRLDLAVFTGGDWSVLVIFVLLAVLFALNAYLSYRLVEDWTAAALGAIATAAFVALAFWPYPFLFASAALLLYQTSRAAFDLLALTGRLRMVLATGARG